MIGSRFYQMRSFHIKNKPSDLYASGDFRVFSVINQHILGFFKVLTVLFLTICAISPEYVKAQSTARSTARSSPNDDLSNARKAFSLKEYDKAIQFYTKYLRKLPNNDRVWAQLAASYYHAGQPRKSQQVFQSIERYATDRSFVYHYQGLCFSVLGLEETAVKYWEYAGLFQDEFGAKSVAELIGSALRTRDIARAKLMAQNYARRFPNGQHAKLVAEVLKSLEPGQKPLENMVVSERPDPTLTVFRYSNLSLFDTPHFWMLQSGFSYAGLTGYQPVFLKGLEQKNSEELAVNINASLGVGPIKQKFATAYAGYSYKQRWNMTQETIQDWLADPGSLESFPLQGELLTRTHQIFGDVRRKFTDSLYAGLHTRFEFSRIGSSFFPSANEADLRVVLSLKDTQLLIPWVGWTWNENAKSMLYLYLKKEIQNNSSDHSNKTYDLLGGSDKPAISFGISNSIDLLGSSLSTSFDIFQYEFIFNDFWLDYTRRGLVASIDYELIPRLHSTLNLGYYMDNYLLSRVRQGSCTTTASTIPEAGGAATAEVSACPRDDTGQLIQAGLYWNQNANLRYSLSYQMVNNNSKMKEYSESINTFKIDVTWAFPGVKRVSRLSERFTDYAFTRDDEQ